MNRRKAAFFVAAVCGVQMLATQMFATAAHAQALDEFFRHQPFRIVVGSPPGGAYDLYARAISRHMSRHLPGQPSVIVQNMPGGGGYLAANFLYNNAPKDGSVIATFSRSVPMQPLFDSTGVQFDPKQFAWIGSPSDEAGLVLSRATSKVKTLADLHRYGMPTVAATGPGTDSNVYARIVSNILGIRMNIVTGYRGAADILLAVERGEADGAAGISWSALWPARKDWIENHKVNLLVQLGLKSTRPQLEGRAADRRSGEEPDRPPGARSGLRAAGDGLSLRRAAGRPRRAPEGDPRRLRRDPVGQGVSRRNRAHRHCDQSGERQRHGRDRGARFTPARPM